MASNMTPGNTVERAFQIAAETKTIEEIKTKLKQEGHSNVDAHLNGRQIRAELSRVMRQSDA